MADPLGRYPLTTANQKENIMSAPETRQAPPRTLMTTVTGDVNTELEPIISGLPWGDAFTFGAGIDAITGAVMTSAVKHFIPVPRTVKTSSEYYSFIQSDSDFNREVEVSASGKYNIQGITPTASTSYLDKITYSEMSITLVAKYHSQYDGYDEAPSYELSDEAKSLIGDPAKFRNVYGDYFVAGGRRSSMFTAVYNCQASSVKSLDEFKASFGASAPLIFSAEGSTRFLEEAKKNKISISVNLFMEGYTGTAPNGPWTPEKIIEALGWFKKNEKGIDLTTKLCHYSTLDPSYPRTIDVAPDVFVELRQLYTAVWDVRAGYSSLPRYYKEHYKSQFTTVEAGVVANQGILATDASKRLQYRQQTDSLLSEISDVYARMDFYYKVKSAVSTEPDKDKQITEGSGQQRWMYGFSVYTKSNAVAIHSTTLHYKKDWEFGNREHTFEFGPDGNNLIAGWEVISNWGDGTNGSWWKAVDKILLTDHAAVHVESEYDRGFDWTLKVYYVDARDYEF